VEWVETTGKTVADAIDSALDQLGVDEQEAEFEILDEPRPGLFGRLRGEARVRARVRPTTPRAKEERQRRKRRPATARGEAPDRAPVQEAEAAALVTTAVTQEPAATAGARPSPRRRGARSPGSGPEIRVRNPSGDLDRTQGGEHDDREVRMDVPLEEQGRLASEFLTGLLEAMQLEADIGITRVDEDILELQLNGPDLGTLIGPKGSILLALQDLTRTVVQRKTGASNGRLMVDVAGYRQRRKQALERFSLDLAEQVLTTQTRRVLEPMIAADRKIVHDTVQRVDGVTSVSEGEDPQRRVIILPAQS
jgi:spoIIIJ-associated protein